MDAAVIGALGTGLSVTTFLVGFSSIRLRGQRDRAVAHSDNVVRDLVRASSEGRALSDAEVEQSTHGFDDAQRLDPVATGAVWFYWSVATLMLVLCIIGEAKSPGTFTLDPTRWYVDTYVVIFLMILQAGICAAGTADYLYVREDLSTRLSASTLGIVDRAMTARDASEMLEAHKLADELIQRLPSWPWAYAFRAHLRTALERPADALQDLDRAVTLKPDDLLARLARAEHRLSTGDPEGALDDLDALPGERQSDNAALKLRGGALYQLGRRAEAIAAFDRVVRSSPADAEARASRGEALTAFNTRAARHRSSSIAALETYVLEESERIAITAVSTVGRESLSREDVETAIQDFSFALSQAPGDRRLLRMRGDAYFRKGDTRSGEADYRAAMEGADSKQLAIALRQRGLSRQRAGDGLGALADFTASIEAEPTHRAHFYRALYYEELGRFDRGLADIDAAARMAPDDDDYLTHRAALLAETGDIVESDAAFRDVEVRFPSNAHNYVVWLGILARRGSLLDALALSGRAIAACPDNPYLRLTAAGIRAENGQVENALREVEKALDLGASQPEASCAAAQVLALAGKLPEAEAEISQAADEPSVNQQFALAIRHKVRRRMGNLEGAIEDLDRAIELAPDSLALHVQRACTRLQLDGPTPTALADIERALAINSRSASALIHLAEWRSAAGDVAGAVEAAETAIAIHADEYGKRTLGSCYFKARRWDEAAEVLSEVVRSDPTDELSLWTLAAAYANGGRFPEAEATFSALLQLDNDDLNARAGFAVTVSQQNRSGEAVELFRLLRRDFGAEAETWIEGSLSPDVLPRYDTVMTDWRASDS